MFERIPNGSFGCAELGPASGRALVARQRDKQIPDSWLGAPVLARPGGCAHHQPSGVRASEIRAVGWLGMTHPPAGRVRLVAVAAIVWSLSFAVIHVAWALGSRVALGGRRVSGVLLAIDIVAIPFCLLAGWVAWRLRDEDHAAPRRAAPRLVGRLAWAACLILGLRGLGTIQALVAPPQDARRRSPA